MKTNIEKRCSNCRYRAKEVSEKPCLKCTIRKVYGVGWTEWKPLTWWQKAADRIGLFFKKGDSQDG